MIAALAEHLEIPYEKASDALNVVWAAASDIDGSVRSWSHDPDAQTPGTLLAQRVQESLLREFGREAVSSTIVLVRTGGHVGIALLGVSASEFEQLMEIGFALARRNKRQHSEGS